MAATHDEHPVVRRWAVEGLRQEGPGVAEALAAALKDADAKVRASAVRTISGHGTDWARAALAAHTQDPDDAVRAAVNQALHDWRR